MEESLNREQWEGSSTFLHAGKNRGTVEGRGLKRETVRSAKQTRLRASKKENWRA